jgi:hypothetical protein
MNDKPSKGLVAAAIAAACFVSAPAMAGGPGPHPTGHRLPSRIQKGKNIAPVPLDLTGKRPAKVWLGSYLVNAVGGCNDCHTNPPYVGGDPVNGDPGDINTANYLAGGMAFGPFISANITPDADGKPAGLTRQEFIAIIRTGHDTVNDDYLQVMPWPVFRHMTTTDLSAIYEYLTAIPHAESAAP